MLEIAGGILLALFILCYWPFVLIAAVLLIGGLATYMVGTYPDPAAVVIVVAVIFWLSVVATLVLSLTAIYEHWRLNK